MGTTQNKFVTVVFVIFALLLFWKTAFMFSAISEFMPTLFLTVLFWVGYILLIIINLLLKPYTFLISSKKVSIKSSVKGILFFLFGTFITIALDYLLDAINSLTIIMQGDWVPILWFSYNIISIFAMVVIPGYLSLQNPKAV